MPPRGHFGLAANSLRRRASISRFCTEKYGIKVVGENGTIYFAGNDIVRILDLSNPFTAGTIRLDVALKSDDKPVSNVNHAYYQVTPEQIAKVGSVKSARFYRKKASGRANSSLKIETVTPASVGSVLSAS